jgi:hypothetical protein
VRSGRLDCSVETELPRAYAVKAEGLEQTSDKELGKELRTCLDGRVANHKRWRGGIRFLKEIPKRAVLRRILREQMLAEEKLMSKLEGVVRRISVEYASGVGTLLCLTRYLSTEHNGRVLKLLFCKSSKNFETFK